MEQINRPFPDRPLPKIRSHTERYWQAAKEHVLALPRCKQCGKFHFYPRTLCPYCWSDDLEWQAASGKGIVYSYTTITQPANQAFAADVPYIFAIVELDEGPHMSTNIVGCRIDEVSIGLPVEVVFEDVTEEITLPKFRIAQ